VLDPDRIYSEEATGRIVDQSTRTLQRKRVAGTGPAYVRLGPRRIGYTGRAILEWIKANTHRHLAAELAARQQADGGHAPQPDAMLK
jgi:predicted DNA-binding transcriptional regulator AlpA